MNVNSSLCLFTNEFPYGNSETYLESEIPLMTELFDKIYIFPSKKKGQLTHKLSSKFEIISFDHQWGKKGNKLFFGNLFFVLNTLFNEWRFCSNKRTFYKKLFFYKNTLLHKLYISEQLEIFLSEKDIEDPVFYSYWFSDWTITLGILKYKKKIRSFVSRAHGFDVYDNRNKDGFIPFRLFQLKMVDRVFSVSMKGCEYLRNKKKFPEKITTRYLGVADRGMNPFQGENRFTIVSCSNVNEFKRLELIIEILRHITFPIHWIHFGDGILMEKMKEKSAELPATITVEFKGRVPNVEILDFYKNNQVDLFMTTSAMEGLPMTLIEAASFGIPLLGTNVGGIPEIINDQTGMLIPEYPDPSAVADMIEDFKLDHGNSILFRRSVKECWKNNFESMKNYTEFYEDIILLSRNAE